MDKNTKLFDQIYEYKKYFDDLEIQNRYRGNAITDDPLNLNLTVEDIKQGKKLSLFKKTNNKRDKIAEKLSYFRNLKPYNGAFKISPMDPNEQVIQETHNKNLLFQEKKNQ